MSAGTGITHSEHNRGEEVLRFLQIWVFRDEKSHQPDYGDHRFPWEARKNQWLLMVSGDDGEAPSSVNGIDLRDRDALEIVGEDLVIRAEATSHLLVVEMAA